LILYTTLILKILNFKLFLTCLFKWFESILIAFYNLFFSNVMKSKILNVLLTSSAVCGIRQSWWYWPSWYVFSNTWWLHCISYWHIIWMRRYSWTCDCRGVEWPALKGTCISIYSLCIYKLYYRLCYV